MRRWVWGPGRWKGGLVGLSEISGGDGDLGKGWRGGNVLAGLSLGLIEMGPRCSGM